MTEAEIEELEALWAKHGRDAFRIIREADPSAFIRLALYAVEIEGGFED